jgi:hypothetical protein
MEIEDLLRLKRAERPPAEFWTEFDRTLRAKQLAALVAKRPWWQRAPGAFARLSRFRLPLGAAAVLAVSFISLRNFDTGAPVGGPEAATHAELDLKPVAPLLPASAAADEAGYGQGSVVAVPAARIEVAEQRTNASLALAVSGSVEAVAPVAASIVEPDTGQETLLGSSFIAASLGSTTVTGATVGHAVFAKAGSFQANVYPVRNAVEPLQQVTPPSERSRSRLLTAMVSMTSQESSVRTTERHANRISEEQLYDQIHRLAPRGAGVSMKF